MLSDTIDAFRPRQDVTVLLDGSEITLPPGRRSLSGIRSYLETLALEQERVLCTFSVDGEPANPARPLPDSNYFERVEGETLDLEHVPLQLLRAAQEQATYAQTQVESGIALVLINDGQVAREFLWNLTWALKQPLITLSLLPETVLGASSDGASVARLRRWQLQQLGAIIRELDATAWAADPRVLAYALESRAQPWLENLKASLELLHEKVLWEAGAPQARTA